MTVLDILAFSQAAKLLGDGLSAQTPFDAGPLSWAVIAVWRSWATPSWRGSRHAREI